MLLAEIAEVPREHAIDPARQGEFPGLTGGYRQTNLAVLRQRQHQQKPIPKKLPVQTVFS